MENAYNENTSEIIKCFYCNREHKKESCFDTFPEMFEWAKKRENFKINSSFDELTQMSIHEPRFYDYIRAKYKTDGIEYKLQYKDFIEYLGEYDKEKAEIKHKHNVECERDRILRYNIQNDVILPPRFKCILTEKQAQFIYNNLSDEFFVQSYNGFLYMVGLSENGNDFQKLEWEKNRQLAREFFEQIQLLTNMGTKADMERIIPNLSIHKNKSLILPKNKPTLSKDSDKIKKIFATL